MPIGPLGDGASATRSGDAGGVVCLPRRNGVEGTAGREAPGDGNIRAFSMSRLLVCPERPGGAGDATTRRTNAETLSAFGRNDVYPSRSARGVLSRSERSTLFPNAFKERPAPPRARLPT